MRIFTDDDLRRQFGQRYTTCRNQAYYMCDDLDDEDRSRVALSIAPILMLGLEFNDLRVLDIGCGSARNTAGEMETYYPFACRVLKKMGAHPIGIDLYSNEGEEFEHHQQNLWEPDTLDMITTSSIDAALAMGVTDSPTLSRTYRGSRSTSSGEIAKTLIAHLTPQIGRVVKPHGYLIYTDHIPADSRFDGER